MNTEKGEVKAVNRAFHRILIICLLMTFVAAPSGAQIYRWVDENGKVRFSDKPPKNEDKQAQKIDISSQGSNSNLSIPSVRRLRPIPNTEQYSGKSIALEHFSIKLDGVTAGENIDLGRAYVYTPSARKTAQNLYRGDRTANRALACKSDGNLKLNNANYISSRSKFPSAAYTVFEKYGYANPNSRAKKFALQKNEGIDLSLAAEVVEMRLAYCGTGTGTSLRQYTQNSTYLKIEWEVFDNLTRKIIYKAKTEGLDDYIQKAPRMNGAPISMELAFQQAIENLLSKQEFIDLILGDSQFSDTSNTPLSTVKVNLVYGNSESSFSQKLKRIKAATATIRTTSGHGSGFVISQQGHVLTNEHVVQNSQNFLVIINGEEYLARVLKTDTRRDIALLQIKEAFDHQPTEIELESAELGDPIYVIGTPLDETLDFSISRGIISSRRDFKGQPYYQTDAAVNPGNSGGPVFNDVGNVIGVTVSGHFTRDGGSRSINYIIPINDALRAIGL